MLSDSRSWKHVVPIVSGAGAGMVCAILCSPLDVAKIRLQVQDAILPAPAAKYRGLWSTLIVIRREEGIRGWYRGLAPAVICAPVFWGVYFYAYEQSKLMFERATGEEHHLLPAVAAGALTDVITNPLWVVRTRMQTQALHNVDGNVASTGMMETFRRIRTSEGWQVFYRGLTASFLGLSHVAIQFPVYERLKATARVRRGGGRETAVDLILASATSKIVGSSVTYPHEVLRARMQDERTALDKPAKTLRQTFQGIIRLEGFRALYRGFSVNMVRVVPSCVVTFLTYELLRFRLLAVSSGVQS